MKKIITDTLAALTHKERRIFMLLVLTDTIVALVDIVSLILLLWVIQFYTQGAPTNSFAGSFSQLFEKNSLLPVVFLLVLFVLKNTAGYILLRVQNRFVYRVALRIAGNNLLFYLEEDYQTYVSVDSAVHFRAISQQPVEFAHYVLSGLQQMITQCLLIIFSITAILVYNAQLFLLLLLLLAVPLVLVGYLLKLKIKLARMQTKATGEAVLQHLREAISGYVESKVYEKKSFFLDRYLFYQQKLNRHLSDLVVVQGIPIRIIEIFAMLGLFILILLTKQTNAAAGTDLITLGAFVAAAYKIIPGLVKLLNLQAQVRAYDFTINALTFKPGNAQSTAAIKQNINSIEFGHVNFNYKQQAILCNVSFIAEKGDLVGISGDSGKGKTTIFHLLLGFLDQLDGDISINGNVSGMQDRQANWPKVAYARQQPFLLHDSILTNIAWGDDRYDEQRLKTIIEKTRLSELIDSVNGNIHAIISEAGKNISGGQAQRIHIARALYKDADVYLLDEPFSELDQATEEHIMKYLRELADKGKIVLLITHKKESLARCNKIVTLANDR